MTRTQNLRRLSLILLMLAGVAMAGETTTSSSLRLTVNVVPAIQIANTELQSPSVIAFGNEAQLQLRMQPSGEQLVEKLMMPKQAAVVRSNLSKALEPTATSVLIRQTYIAK
jgi:hypothetical protein